MASESSRRIGTGSPFEDEIGFSRAIRIGDRVIVSGTAPVWPDGNVDPDVARRATEGFLRGTARLDGLGDDRGRSFELAFQNEFAVGWLDGEPRVTTPDLICVMDTVSGEAIGTEISDWIPCSVKS